MVRQARQRKKKLNSTGGEEEGVGGWGGFKGGVRDCQTETERDKERQNVHTALYLAFSDSWMQVCSQTVDFLLRLQVLCMVSTAMLQY